MGNFKKIKLLVVAAYGPELKALISLGRKHAVIRDGVAYLQAGIGPVAATFGLTHFLEDYRPQKIMAIGTAGTFNAKRFPVGTIVQAKSVSMVSHLPGFYACVDSPLAPWGEDQGEGKDPTLVRVYAPQEITCDAKCALQLAKHHDVEHLESYAYALVAQKFKIPLQIILGLTNIVGPKGHAEWQKNEAAVMKRVAESVTDLCQDTGAR
jgi:nucleoside phosphorylase